MFQKTIVTKMTSNGSAVAKPSMNPSLGAIPKTVSDANPMDKYKRGDKLSGQKDTEMCQAQWTSTRGKESCAKPSGDANLYESFAKLRPSGGIRGMPEPRGELELVAETNPLKMRRECDPQPSTSPPSKDPANVVQPGWRSSQVIQGSGVFGGEGARQGEENKELPLFDEEDLESEMILLTLRAEAEVRKEEMKTMAEKKMKMEEEERKMVREIQNLRIREDRIQEAATKSKAAREKAKNEDEEWWAQALYFEESSQRKEQEERAAA